MINFLDSNDKFQGLLVNDKFENLVETLKAKNKKVDGVITSPPYNTARVVNTARAMENHENRYGKYQDNLTFDQYIDWTVDIFNNFDQILKDDGCICYNISYSSENVDKATLMWRAISEIIAKTPFVVADVIYWKKSNALPNNVSHNKVTRIIEPVFIFCREKEFKTFNANKTVKSQSKTGQNYYNNVYNYIEAKNNDEATKVNKATYSSDLVKSLIDIYFKEGSVICDPFMGTGTTAVACIENGCKFIGSEIDEAQIEHSRDRIVNSFENFKYIEK